MNANSAHRLDEILLVKTRSGLKTLQKMRTQWKIIGVASLIRRKYSSNQGTECVLETLESGKKGTGSFLGIRIITLNRPQSKNALGKVLLSQFVSHLDHLRHDP